MTTKQQKIRIGLFAVIAGALLGLVLIVFGGVHLFWRDRAHYVIEFEDSVYGLQEGAEVYLNGIRVGSVSEVRVAPQDLRHVLVEIAVDEDTQVRADTKAMLQMAGITGLKVIDLRGGSLAAARLPKGAKIAVGQTALDKLEKQAATMADQAGEIMARANRIVANVETLTDPSQLGGIVEQTRKTTENLAGASAQLSTMIAENRTALRASIQSVNDAAKSATQLLDGDVAGLLATAGDVIVQLKDVVHDDGAQLKGAMSDLRQASRSFKELAREVRARPSRLLFSSPQPDRKLP